MSLRKEQPNGEVTKIPIPEEALLSRGVGKTFKPEGRPVVPEDCAMYNDFAEAEGGQRMVHGPLLIQKLFEKGGYVTIAEFDDPNDPGKVARYAYGIYTSALGKSDETSVDVREKANQQFREIAGFGLEEVVKFENEVRKLHRITLLPVE